MNLLYCLTAYPPSTGGAQTHFHEIAKSLSGPHTVRVLCHWTENRTDWLRGVTLNAPGNATYTQDGVKVTQMNFEPAERKRLAFWAWAYYVVMGASVRHISQALYQKLEQAIGPVDVVHAGRAGREFLAWAALKLARVRHIPFVFTPFHHPKWSGWRWRWYARLYREADAVMALTQAEKKLLQKMGVRPERIHVIGHAPQPPAQMPGPGYFGSGAPVVLFLGQKYAYKGIAQLLRAMPAVWQKFPETRFAFIGPRTAYSQRLFRGVNDARVIEKDTVSEPDKWAALADCAVFCLPSRQESFGGVFAEAWLAGKPVIGGDIPAIREVIQPGRDGELVSASSHELAEKLIRLLSDPDRCQALGEQGRHKAREQFNWERVAQAQAAVYQQLRSAAKSD